MFEEDISVKQLCKQLNIIPSEIINIGNDYESDYYIPLMIGIKSFLLDREGNQKEEYVIRDLYELQDKLNKFV